MDTLGIEALTAESATLERGLAGAADMAGAFNGELARMRESMVFTGREVGTLSGGIARSLRRAFDGVVFDGMRLQDALKGVMQSLSAQVFNVAMRPVEQALGGAIAGGLNGLLSGALPFAEGAAFSQGRVMPFAKGGIVTQPTTFPMRGATGLMGEAGPEAIMPLARGPDGTLGVRGGGAAPVTLVMNVTTHDAASFSRSRSQIAAQMQQILARGERNR